MAKLQALSKIISDIFKQTGKVVTPEELISPNIIKATSKYSNKPFSRGSFQKRPDQINTDTQVKKDMVDQMNLPEDGAFRTDPNSGVQIPTTEFENNARRLGIERNINTPSLDNTNTTRIANSKAEWAAEQAAYDAEREAARLAGIKERWLARLAKDKEDALRNNEVVEKKIVEIEPSNDYQSMILGAESKKAAKREALANAKKKGGVGSKTRDPAVQARTKKTAAMNKQYYSTSLENQNKFNGFAWDNGYNHETLRKMIFDKWVNPDLVKNPVSYEGAVNKLVKLDKSDMKAIFPNANKNAGQLRRIEKNRLKRIEADKLEKDALKILKEQEEQLARRIKDSGVVKREYTGNQEFDIGPDGTIIPTKK